jgi:hypothetical protein
MDNPTAAQRQVAANLSPRLPGGHAIAVGRLTAHRATCEIGLWGLLRGNDETTIRTSECDSKAAY